ncbi:MAG: hypothetical protein ACR2L1_08295 [Pyrinomonadaceae bacterium]
MNENITTVFHGFLNLTGKEKLQKVEAINDYFDSNDREPIRSQNEASFAEIYRNEGTRKCKCCGG